MAVRSGMATILGNFRPMIGLGTAEFTVNGTAYFTDAQLQDHLDRARIDLTRHKMTPVIEYSGGSPFYYRYLSGFQNLETYATDYGTAFLAEYYDGADIGTANFTPNYLLGELRFSSDQAGSAIYLTARSYDLNRAALSVWREIASLTAPYYQFAADDQRFNRDQWHDHAIEQVMLFSMAGGIQAAHFVRSDLN